MTRRLLSFLFLIVLAGSLFSAEPAHAQDARKFGSYGDWDAYTFLEDGHKVCYVASSPSSAKGNYKKRGGIFAMVTHRPAEKSLNVFSYLAGYTYKKGDAVTLTIDGQPQTLYGDGEVAWTANPAADEKLIAALRRGKTLTVKGRSDRDTETVDTFSLKGSGAALDAISKECDINQ